MAPGDGTGMEPGPRSVCGTRVGSPAEELWTREVREWAELRTRPGTLGQRPGPSVLLPRTVSSPRRSPHLTQRGPVTSCVGGDTAKARQNTEQGAETLSQGDSQPLHDRTWSFLEST